MTFSVGELVWAWNGRRYLQLAAVVDGVRWRVRDADFYWVRVFFRTQERWSSPMLRRIDRVLSKTELAAERELGTPVVTNVGAA
jgi:hypothetical protein